MDQIEIYNRLQELLEDNEITLAKHLTHLQNQTIKIIQEGYEKYGGTLAEYKKYNRLDSLKKQLDDEATKQYQKILQDVNTSQAESFNKAYLLYAYLIYLYFSNKEGKLIKITSSAAKTSAIIGLLYALLKSKKKIIKWLLNDTHIQTLTIFEKHKNDYVYNVYMDLLDSLKTEEDLTTVIKRVKKRTENAKKYGIRRLRDFTNRAINYAKDKIYEQAEKKFDVKKMWLSMRDTSVRESHRKLDSQIADQEGYFHYGGDKARQPGTWAIPGMNFGCRCIIFLMFNGKFPKFSRIYDYQDEKYQHKLITRIEELMPNQTYLQALKQAQKEIKPPKITSPYITFEDWLKNYGDLN